MDFQLAAFFRTTMPLDLGRLSAMDGGRYHSIWLPDHLVSLWPDSIWTEEFTDLARVSPSPHRYLDSLSLAGAVAVKTQRALIATSVVDTVRRHPVLLAQAGLTLGHLSQGRFILGLGSGEKENILPYGFDFARPVSRFEEALRIIRLLWSSDGPVDFEGRFYRLERARLDTEAFEGRPPPIWIGSAGPRMLELTGRYADGWWPAGFDGPEEFAEKLARVRLAAEKAGRDPLAIETGKMITCILGERDEIAEMLRQPLVKSLALQLTSESYRRRGYRHPMGENWHGIHDVEPDKLTRDRLVSLFDEIDGEAILSVIPHGTPKEVAREIKALHEAGVRIGSILDYSGMAGQKFGALSPAKVRETEDEALRLIRGDA